MYTYPMKLYAIPEPQQKCERDQVLFALADAVSESRTACELEAKLTQKGRWGLLRIMELVLETPIPAYVAEAAFFTMDMLADMIGVLYALMILESVMIGPDMCGELLRMIGELMAGEWFA